MSETGTEVRMVDGALDEIVGVGVNVHVEDLGGAVFFNVYGGTDNRYVIAMAIFARLPREAWWDEIVDAWHERRWPCFWTVMLRLEDDFTLGGAGPP